MVEQLNTANHNHYPYILYFSVPDDFKTIWTRKNGLERSDNYIHMFGTFWKQVTDPEHEPIMYVFFVKINFWIVKRWSNYI